MAWNRPSTDSKTETALRRTGTVRPTIAVRGLIAGVIVVVGAGIAMWWLWPEDMTRQDAASTRKGLIREMTPTIPTNAPAVAEVSRESSKERILEELKEPAGEFVRKAPTNNIVWMSKALKPNDPDNALRKRTAFALGALLSIRPGEHIPSFMTLDFLMGGKPDRADGGNARFVNDLKKWQIEIKEGDSEHLAAHKKDLFDAQLELIKNIDEGVSVNDSIRAAYQYRVNAAEFRDSLIQMVKELHRESPDRETTRSMIAQANKKLEEQGIKGISEGLIIREDEEEQQHEKEQPNE